MDSSEIIQIYKPAPPAIVAELSPLVAAAQLFEVTDVDSDRIAQERGAQCRRGEKNIEAHFKAMKDAANAAHKLAVAAIAGLTGPIAAARTIYYAKSDTYQADQRRIAEEETRRLQELARKEEVERQINAAIEAEAQGDAATSDAILAEPVSAPVVTVAPAVAKVDGVATMTRWEPEIVDVRACLRFLCDRPEWEAALDRLKPELVTILRPLAVAQRQALNIPGVRAISKTIRSTR